MNPRENAVLRDSVQGTVGEISGHTGISQIPLYINWLEQAHIKRIYMALRKEYLTKPLMWKIVRKRKAVGNEEETST